MTVEHPVCRPIIVSHFRGSLQYHVPQFRHPAAGGAPGFGPVFRMTEPPPHLTVMRSVFDSMKSVLISSVTPIRILTR